MTLILKFVVPMISISMIILLPHFTIFLAAGTPVGVCYGRSERTDDTIPTPYNAVNLIQSNGISRIRLFNADRDTLKPFSHTGIELVVGVPNRVLPALANGSITSSLDWLMSNVFAHVSPNQVLYLAVGNEILREDNFYSLFIVPAIINLHQALRTLGLEAKIKISSPQAASILSNSYPPSAGEFDPNFKSVIIPLLMFLANTGSPLMVNIYPFFSYINDPEHISLEYVLFRSSNVDYDILNSLTYDNLFDASIDAFVYAMEKEGFHDIPVVVTETGWPTSGGNAASSENALSYNENVLRRSLNNVGTPKRPGIGIEVFLFDLLDDDQNGRFGDEYEKHFGIFGSNGSKAYDLQFK